MTMLPAEAMLNVDGSSQDLKTLVDDYERRLIMAALGACGGQQNRAAALLGVLPTTLHEKMKRLGLNRGFGMRAPDGAETVVLDQPANEFRWRGVLADDATLEIKGTMGRVRVVAVPGDEAEVVALRSAAAAPGQVAVNVLEHSGGVMFSVYHSKPAALDAATGSRERAASVLGRLRVDFDLRVPASTALNVRLYSGNIEVYGVSGKVEAHTMNGVVRIGQSEPTVAA